MCAWHHLPVLQKLNPVPHLVKLALKAVPLKRVGGTLRAKLVVPADQGDEEITARATDITLAQALALMLYPEGLTASEAIGELRVEKLPPR